MRTQVDSQHLIFFMDDFGTRTMCNPAEEMPMAPHEFSFGLGGILVPSEAVAEISQAVIRFCEKWRVPELHGNKIRSGKGKFAFLKEGGQRRERFFAELEDLLIDERMLAHACVICRPGYRDRYFERYPVASRWHMSRTAFDIAVERAAKFAIMLKRRLSIVYERSGQKEDRLIESYFHGLKTIGTEFDVQNAGKHSPLPREELSRTLLTIWPDGKANPMLQLADLVIHPLCHRPTGLPNRAYSRLEEARQILDFRCNGDATIAVKYSCYDGTYQKPEGHTNT
ncbi:hypothetical protein J2045_004003 [Peteryoungia aggregata LMG 23059]|uniref:DUF3800 domain-containing protein n=1 Tax=Peteryoungia aggregata LMG 23059 TaxID=1368425 RepID=A0ABU0GCB9_9HYPH|nr:DUF3800 domain-containing protein [Peteryoungia aggregata]MDQ0422953.1 hypothetical protein [Peteryoungia aggregata LMG 23059]